MARPPRTRHLAAGLVAASALATAASLAGGGAGPPPTVIIQAGHVAPREPGYRLQTGASGGPFGGETGFTARAARALRDELRRRGVRARITPGRVVPWGAPADAFIALHHDARGGVAGVAHAVAGTPEYYYRGEGHGEPRPHRPYPDSAPHRRSTSIPRAVERRSRVLARAVARSLGRVATPRNGLRSGWDGVVPVDRHKRMSRYYAFRRTRAAARIIVEVGAAGTDDRFLARPRLIARAIADGVEDALG